MSARTIVLVALASAALVTAQAVPPALSAKEAEAGELGLVWRRFLAA